MAKKIEGNPAPSMDDLKQEVKLLDEQMAPHHTSIAAKEKEIESVRETLKPLVARRKVVMGQIAERALQE